MEVRGFILAILAKQVYPTSLRGVLISEVANFIRKNEKHGIQLIPGQDEIFLLLFTDDIVLLSSTPTGLQNQINSLEKVSSSLGLVVNLEKKPKKTPKVMVFRKGGHIAATEKWFYHHTEIEIVNSYKYLGYTLTTKLSSHVACREYSNKAKGKNLRPYENYVVTWKLRFFAFLQVI